MEERYIASVDLGTSKLAVCVACIQDQNVQIIYYKESPSAGIRNSCVAVPGKVWEKVKVAIEEAQQALKIRIQQVVVGLPRWQVRQETASAIAVREADSDFITEGEIRLLKSEALKSYPLKDEKKEVIYGAVAQSFSADDNFSEPESEIVGMSAERLEGHFKVFIGSKTYSTNIDKLFSGMRIGIAKKFFVPGITAKAVLKPDEMENGVALIDLGAGVSSVTIFKNNLMRYYAAIPFGGDCITRDIASICGFTFNMSENIKKAYGACMPDKLSTLGDKVLHIVNDDGVTTKRLSIKVLSEIIHARMEEIINALLYKIQESGFSSEDDLKKGLVITGGGAELLNCINLFKEISGYSVKLGLPNKYVSCDGCPEASTANAATAVGMILAVRTDRSVNSINDVYRPLVKPDTTQTQFTKEERRPESAPAKPSESYHEEPEPVSQVVPDVSDTPVATPADEPGVGSERYTTGTGSHETVTETGHETGSEPDVIPPGTTPDGNGSDGDSDPTPDIPPKSPNPIKKFFWKLYESVCDDVDEGL